MPSPCTSDRDAMTPSLLEKSFEFLAERSRSSVPTIMRTCRDLGFAGLREFKLALAQELALGGSPLHRRVNIEDAAAEVVAKVARSAAASVAGVRNQLDMAALDAAVAAIATAPHIDIYGAGNTSWFMASDLQARLFGSACRPTRGPTTTCSRSRPVR